MQILVGKQVYSYSVIGFKQVLFLPQLLHWIGNNVTRAADPGCAAHSLKAEVTNLGVVFN